MHVQPVLITIKVGTLIQGAVVMMVAISVVMVPVMVMMTLVQVARLVVCVSVHQSSRKRSDWRGKSYAHAWRQSKHQRHRPN